MASGIKEQLALSKKRSEAWPEWKKHAMGVDKKMSEKIRNQIQRRVEIKKDSTPRR